MKTNELLRWMACLVLVLSTGSSQAEETATVKEGKVNVRGQPSLIGEVITQLQKGEKVVVLEEITLTKPKTNEPPKWARIQMPPNTPVWVYAPFIDPATKTVKVTRLNLRGGPGENYSVVGRLEKAAPVSEIRRVEDWMEIETPPGAYGFVAANLLTKGELAAAPVAKPEAPKPAAPVIPPPAETAKTEPVPPSPATPPAVARENPLAAAQQPPPVAPAPEPAPVEKPVETAKAQETPQPTPPPVGAKDSGPTVIKPPEPAHILRVVRREGIVRSTVSIQAPTYYELLSPENHKTINYIHTDKLDVNLKDYRGRRIVVTGEEELDSRWPNTPVIEVDKLELIP